MKILAIIQARTSSTRLPGKFLADIVGAPMLLRVAQRVRKARRVNDVLIATSTASSDDAIAHCCGVHGLNCFRGHLDDVLDRFYQAARSAGADSVVRITADCPLMDP